MTSPVPAAVPPPVNRFVRPADPETSLESARRAAKASPQATAAVRQVMRDGIPRIDEEIRLACQRPGIDYTASLATIQHGRLALSSAGFLVETGETRRTTNGMPSRVWVWADGNRTSSVVADRTRANRVAQENEYLHRQRALKELRASRTMADQSLAGQLTDEERHYWWRVRDAVVRALAALGEQ